MKLKDESIYEKENLNERPLMDLIGTDVLDLAESIFGKDNGKQVALNVLSSLIGLDDIVDDPMGLK